MRNIPDLIFWLAVLIFFTDAGKTVIELVHGPQPKSTIEAPIQSKPYKEDNELKPSW